MSFLGNEEILGSVLGVDINGSEELKFRVSAHHFFYGGVFKFRTNKCFNIN